MKSRSGLNRLVIDEFALADGRSALGTRWVGFTDTVMGGRSRGSAERVVVDGVAALRLRGTVSLENNGGFIQAALPLAADDGAFDASRYEGIALRTRGVPGPYYLHLRTRDTIRPWQLYHAPLAVAAEWASVFVPFTSFQPQRLERALDRTALRRLGVVAYGAAFEADLLVTSLAFLSNA